MYYLATIYNEFQFILSTLVHNVQEIESRDVWEPQLLRTSMKPTHVFLYIFLLLLYSGGEMWKSMWNQTHLVVLNFCLERLHRVTISHDKSRSNRSCQ